MNQAVVVGTWYGGIDHVQPLLLSLKGCSYPVWVVVNGAAKADRLWLEDLADQYNLLTVDEDRYELGAISAVLEETDIDEFVFLQDTFEVLDQAFLDLCFDHPASVALGVAGFHYAWKYRREVLQALQPIPVISTKRESVYFEGVFARGYWTLDPDTLLLDPHFHDGEHQGFEERFGRTNMVLKNQWYAKYKGDWGQRPL